MATRIEDFRDDFDVVPESEWVFAEVPAEDVMGDAFPTIRINDHAFEPGFNEPVPPKYAEHIKILIAGHNAESVRRLQPKKDMRAIRQQAGAGNIKGGSAVKVLP